MMKEIYPSIEDFKMFSGVDLEETFFGSEGAEAFVYRVISRLQAWLRSISNFDVEYPKRPLTQYQLAEWKLACMEQLAYVLKNGEVQTDSGYDPVQMRAINEVRIQGTDISRMALLHLKNGGFLNNSLHRGGFGDILRGLI